MVEEAYAYNCRLDEERMRSNSKENLGRSSGPISLEEQALHWWRRREERIGLVVASVPGVGRVRAYRWLAAAN
jgi:hypothetical protein